MQIVPFTKGLHRLAEGIYAYLQPNGSWGLSNAGLIVGDDESLLVDTLFDHSLTWEMLAAMTAAVPAAGSIRYLVNTHANGDHCYGNELVTGAEIIASRACAAELAQAPPAHLAHLLQAVPQLGELGEYLQKCFGRFQFDGITPVGPGRTFAGALEVSVGGRTVRLLEVGPAHTQGDVIVYVPDAGVIFAGDILFIGGTPIMWSGPVDNWLKACDLLLALEPAVIVPGHGPVTDATGVRAVKGYFEYLRAEARRRFDTGMDARAAAWDIDITPYRSWTDRERIVVNVASLYREFSGETKGGDFAAAFTAMAQYAKYRLATP